jgi:hypothetical protein
MMGLLAMWRFILAQAERLGRLTTTILIHLQSPELG